MGMSADSGSLQSEINVTPMVDIMLVLLIIFMVVTPLLQSGVNVTLPRGKNPDEDGNITKDTAVVISIPDAGFYYLGRDLVPKEYLVSKIKTKMDGLKPSDPKVIYIKGGNNVPYGEVVKLVNYIRDAGYDQLGLVADKKKPNEQ